MKDTKILLKIWISYYNQKHTKKSYITSDYKIYHILRHLNRQQETFSSSSSPKISFTAQIRHLHQTKKNPSIFHEHTMKHMKGFISRLKKIPLSLQGLKESVIIIIVGKSEEKKTFFPLSKLLGVVNFLFLKAKTKIWLRKKNIFDILLTLRRNFLVIKSQMIFRNIHFIIDPAYTLKIFFGDCGWLWKLF